MQGRFAPDVRDVAERAFAAFAWGGALFSLWAWWFARIGEPLDAGMAAWAALAVFIVDAWRRNGWKATRPSARAYALAAFGLAAYWVARPFLPISLCGLFGVLGGVSLLVPATRDQGEFPAPLAGLDQREVRFGAVVEKDQMPQTVEAFLA